MSIRPPANYRIARVVLLVVFAIAMLLSVLGSVTGSTDLLTGVWNSG
ncbi:hypothetical protein [Saccharopolyspora phatthalungensis]|uniref:Uncharacterized protein n=1 Tax=Saccharopolyspora phatthalungensis TaxID=664693 RepID=A0A840PYT9_9PSEU|nr:hypothetical protein [Saccharopolyspora phatthalungensis]MBB5153144.1 hypothetical protein [Saccharopolyspora phatthalungensis]